MANNYKQVFTTLSTTDATSVYTVPDDKVAAPAPKQIITG